MVLFASCDTNDTDDDTDDDTDSEVVQECLSVALVSLSQDMFCREIRIYVCCMCCQLPDS